MQFLCIHVHVSLLPTTCMCISVAYGSEYDSPSVRGAVHCSGVPPALPGRGLPRVLLLLSPWLLQTLLHHIKAHTRPVHTKVSSYCKDAHVHVYKIVVKKFNIQIVYWYVKRCPCMHNYRKIT